MYPNISRILRPPKRFEEVMGGAFEKEVEGKEIKFYIPDAAVDVPDSDSEEEEEEEQEGDDKKDDDKEGWDEDETEEHVPKKLFGAENSRRRTGVGRRRTYSSDEMSDEDEDKDSGVTKKEPRDEIDMQGLFRVFIHPSSVNFSNTQFGKSR